MRPLRRDWGFSATTSSRRRRSGSVSCLAHLDLLNVLLFFFLGVSFVDFVLVFGVEF